MIQPISFLYVHWFLDKIQEGSTRAFNKDISKVTLSRVPLDWFFIRNRRGFFQDIS